MGNGTKRDFMSEEWSQIMVAGGHVDHSSRNNDSPVRRRILLFSAIIFICMAALLARLVFIQVVSGADYQTLANGNRIRLFVDYAPRGKIISSDGTVLAENYLTFQLSATPYLLEEDEIARGADIRAVANILDAKPAELNKELLAEGLDYVLPVPVAEGLSHEQAIELKALIPELKGFSLEEVPTRRYKSDSALAHVVGYIGRAGESDLDADENGRLLPTDFVGRTGIEKYYDDTLRGRNGFRRVEVDAFGRPVRVLSQQTPVQGQDIRLTLNYKVQKSLAASMRQQMDEANSSRAAGIATDPMTGKIIAMVSLPAYDNNLFTLNFDQKKYRRLVNDKNQPLYNKVTAGGYTSGSIIKPLVASAGLQEGVINENTVIVDNGAITLPGGFTFLGWRPEGLGPMNVRSAIAWSSNIYFYTVGGGYGAIGGLGEERLTKYYRMFGLGEQTGVDLPNETAGRVPDEAWKLANKGEPWYVGDSYNISIGQGDLLISPLQINLAHAAIANNGSVLSPHLRMGADTRIRRELEVDKKYLQIVREGMRQVLTDGTTCECTFDGIDVKVAGKSGTAETNTPGGRPPHAWYSAYAPYGSPEILITVLLEEGVGGSQFAAPAIAGAFETYFGMR